MDGEHELPQIEVALADRSLMGPGRPEEGHERPRTAARHALSMRRWNHVELIQAPRLRA